MILVLCSDPLEPRQPDRSFASEIAAIEALGLPYVLVDHDALVRGEDGSRVVRRVPREDEVVLGVYRGWMMTVGQYSILYEALLARNLRLINDPIQYRTAHHLPENYPFIEELTPRSVWVSEDLGLERIMETLVPFGDRPVLVKDYVKSRKHEWRDACFIPSASDRDEVSRVVANFLERQGDDLAGGLVFREFATFEPMGIHPKSGMPLTREYRLFWSDGRSIFEAPYWEQGGDDGEGPPIADFVDVAKSVPCRFFTMDVAKRVDGGWSIVEIGDGQVSGLPSESAARPFYQALASVLGAEEGVRL